MAVGNFTPSVIPALKFKLEQMFDQDRHKKEFIADVVSLNKIIANQTAKVNSLESTKNHQVEVTWIDAKAVMGTDPIAESCTIGGTFLETKKQAYDLTLSRQAKPFRVLDYIYRNNIYDQNDIVERGLAMQIKELDNYVCQSVLAKLATMGGTNLDNTGEMAATDMKIDPTVTTFVPSKWNADLMVYFELVKIMNRFNEVYLLHGMNLWQIANIAPDKANNSDEKDILSLIQRYNHTWDPFNFTKLGLQKTSFMIEGNSIAFAARNYQGAADKPEANTMVFSVPSGNIPGLNYDVTMQVGCDAATTAGRRDYYVAYEMSIPKFDLLQNPVNGVAGDTGVLKLVNGALPA